MLKSSISNFDAKNPNLETSVSNQNSMFLVEKQEKMFANLEKSIKQKKWLSSSMMSQRDFVRQNSNRKAKLRMIVLKEIVSTALFIAPSNHQLNFGF